LTRSLAVAAGGGVGAGLRYGVARAVPLAPGGLPWATLAVNVVGCLLLGAVVAAVTRRRLPDRAGDLLGPGLCGGLTTFSTYAVESLALVHGHRPAAAAGYVAVSVAAGLLTLRAGARLVGSG
jgi:CrcB protein